MSNCVCRRGLLKSHPKTPNFRGAPAGYPGTCTCSRKMRDSAGPLVLPNVRLRTELELVPEWNHRDLRMQTTFNYSSPATRKLATRRCDAPMKVSSVLGSSGKGIRDDRKNTVFGREVGRRPGSFSCHSCVVGLRRGHDCGQLGFDLQRDDDCASERHPSSRRKLTVLGYGHSKLQSGRYLVGEWSALRKRNRGHDRRDWKIHGSVQPPFAGFGQDPSRQRG